MKDKNLSSFYRTKAKFLKTMRHDEFSFDEGELYDCVPDTTVPELKGFVLVKQPNSPKNKLWWCKIPRSEIGKIIELVER